MEAHWRNPETGQVECECCTGWALDYEALRKERDAAWAANERDRTVLAKIVSQIDEEITGRLWLIGSRGSYEWDDDKYQQEFGWAVKALQEKLEPLRKIAADLKDSPKTQAKVDEARIGI